MNYVARSNTKLAKPRAWTVNRRSALPAKPAQLDIVTRRYEISWLNSDGTARDKPCVAPALPVFEAAFSSFAQGALIQTDNGYVAIEDLVCGDVIATVDGGSQTLQWIGSMTMYPQNLELGVPVPKLFRLTDGGYGHDIGTPDLMMGPGARILPGVLATNSSSPLVPVSELADGFSVIGINPVSPVRVFHLGLERHSLIRANGIVAESYHPGSSPHMEMPSEVYGHFLGLFPHLESVDEFGSLNHGR